MKINKIIAILFFGLWCGLIIATDGFEATYVYKVLTIFDKVKCILIMGCFMLVSYLAGREDA